MTEVFIVPSKDIQVLKAGANVRKKDNIVVVNSKSTATNDGKTLSECWKFDDSDPLGKYQMDLQINDIVFKNLNFELGLVDLSSTNFNQQSVLSNECSMS